MTDETLYNFYPFATQSIEQYWQSYVFLFTQTATLLFFMSLPLYWNLSRLDIKFMTINFWIYVAEWADELLTGSTPYWGEFISFNTISFGGLATYTGYVKWRISRKFS